MMVARKIQTLAARREPRVIWSRASRLPHPPSPQWSGKPPPLLPRPVVWALVWWCGVWWGQICAGKSWWGRIRGPSRVDSPGGREASLVRQTIFCVARFCSETLRCELRCFGRLWRFLLGTIQYSVIESVPMTSRPPIIYSTPCYILYTLYSRVYTTYYRLYSV